MKLFVRSGSEPVGLHLPNDGELPRSYPLSARANPRDATEHHHFYPWLIGKSTRNCHFSTTEGIIIYHHPFGWLNPIKSH